MPGLVFKWFPLCEFSLFYIPWDSPGKNTGLGCHFLLQCMKVKSESELTQSCLTPHYPMDCSPLGSSVHGISQAKVLEWVAIYGVAQSWTWLKRLSSSSSRVFLISVIVLFVSICLFFNSSRSLLIDSCVFSNLFQGFWSSLLSLFWILFQVVCLFPLHLFWLLCF